MNNSSQIQLITAQLQETWNGDPWFGRSITSLLEGITDTEAYMRPSGQHSIADLVWHMINWRQMVLNRLQTDDIESLQQFEEMDWRTAGAEGSYTFSEGRRLLQQTQAELLEILAQQKDDLLEKPVVGREYNFSTLLHGIVQHDIYHLGQIAYLRKLSAAGEKL